MPTRKVGMTNGPSEKASGTTFYLLLLLLKALPKAHYSKKDENDKAPYDYPITKAHVERLCVTQADLSSKGGAFAAWENVQQSVLRG